MTRKPTIYEDLKAKLGREPTNAELSETCKRIIRGQGIPTATVCYDSRVCPDVIEGRKNRCEGHLE